EKLIVPSAVQEEMAGTILKQPIDEGMMSAALHGVDQDLPLIHEIHRRVDGGSISASCPAAEGLDRSSLGSPAALDDAGRDHAARIGRWREHDFLEQGHAFEQLWSDVL